MPLAGGQTCKTIVVLPRNGINTPRHLRSTKTSFSLHHRDRPTSASCSAESPGQTCHAPSSASHVAKFRYASTSSHVFKTSLCMDRVCHTSYSSSTPPGLQRAQVISAIISPFCKLVWPDTKHAWADMLYLEKRKILWLDATHISACMGRHAPP